MKNYKSLIAKAFSQPLAYSHAQKYSLQQQILAFTNELPVSIEPEISDNVEVQNNIAIIDFVGTVMNDADPWLEEYWGVVNPVRFAHDIERIIEAGIPNVFIYADSFGGTVAGTQTAYNALSRLREVATVIVYAENMASAASWALSPATAIFGTETGTYGSNGVIAPLIDDSAFYENLGVKFDWVRSGDKKALGQEGEEITDAIRQDVQARVDELFSIMWSDITAFRDLPESLQDGSDHLGTRAVELNIIDGVLSLQEAFGLFED